MAISTIGQSDSDALISAVGRCPAIHAILDQLGRIEEVLLDREKPFYSVEQVAARYGRTAYTIRRWIAEGRLTATRIAEGGPRGRLMISREELNRLDRVRPSQETEV